MGFMLKQSLYSGKNSSAAKFIRGATNATSNFLNHLKRFHESEIAKYDNDKKDDSKRRKLEVNEDPQQTVMTSFVRVDQSKSLPGNDKSFMKFVVNGLQPLSIVDEAYFTELIHDLRPDVHVLSRRTLTRRLEKQYEDMKSSLIRVFEKTTFVCITADIWTCRGMSRSFLGVTIHWIEDDMERKSAAIACRRFKGSHTYDRIAELLTAIFKEYKLNVSKIVCAVTDNGSNFVKAFREFQVKQCEAEDEIAESEEGAEIHFPSVDDILKDVEDGSFYELPHHQRCASHTLSLICTSDLLAKTTKLHKSTMAKCYGIWNKAARSSKSSESIQEICKKQLIKPCITRWNSLYDSISDLIQHENNLDRVCGALGVPLLLDKEKLYLKELKMCLQPIAVGLDKLQAEKSMFFGKLVPTLLLIESQLSKLNELDLKESKYLVPILLNGLRTRFKDFVQIDVNDVKEKSAVIASISHPYFKLRWIPSDKLQALKELFIETVTKESENLQQNSNGDTQMSSVGGKEEEDDYYGYQVQPTEVTALGEVQDECRKYFLDPSVSVGMLDAYPRIKNVFKKYNTPLPSSAPVERLFSYSNLILKPNRMSLNDVNFEMLLLLRVNKTSF